jgi:phosphoribosylformylglycinamidine synthase
MVRILFHGETAAEIPATALADNTPIYHRELLPEPPAYAQQAWQWTADSLPPAKTSGIEIAGKLKTWKEILLQLLDSPSIASKRWVYRQYDHQVQNNTVLLPGAADAAVIRLRPIESKAETGTGVAATVDCNARYTYLNPYEGAKAAVAEAARNLSCVGAEPLAVTDNLNFGSPENPVGYWQLALACQGIAEACRELATPVTGGNVSLYNETLDSQGNPQAIYPTPVIGMIGRIPDISKVCGQGWQNKADLIYLIGDNTEHQKSSLGASEYLAVIHRTVAGAPPVVDWAAEKPVQTVCRHGIRQEWVNSAHDCAEGGLAIALAECCISGERGAEVSLPGAEGRIDELLFGEAASRILVSVKPGFQPVWEAYLREQLGDRWQYLGQVTEVGSPLQVTILPATQIIKVNLGEMVAYWSTAIERRLKGAGEQGSRGEKDFS